MAVLVCNDRGPVIISEVPFAFRVEMKGGNVGKESPDD
jgi:hypothetical protein